MVAALAGLSFGVGVLAAAVSLLLPLLSGRRLAFPDRPRALSALALGLALTALLFLLTLPTTPPFSPGQRLGVGFLIGGVFGLLAAAGCLGLARREEPYWPYPGILALSLALAAVSLAFLLFGGDPGSALLGCALGFGMIAGLTRLMMGGEGLHSLEAAAALAATLAAACLLAAAHFDKPALRGWWAFPLALAATWVLAQAVAHAGAATKRSPAIRVAAAALLAAVLTLLGGLLLARRLGPLDPLAALLVTGFVTAALIVWLTNALAGEPQVRGPALPAALSALLMLFALVLGFKLLQGFGAGLALLGAWAVIASGLARGGARSFLPIQMLIFGANFLLLRLFLERIGAGPGDVQPDLHYTLIGVLLGALLPVVSLSLCARPGLGRTLLLGLLTAASPLILVTLWGPDAAVGLLLGLIVAPALAVVTQPEAESWLAPAGLVSLGLALVTVQFGEVFATLYLAPRAHKVYLAGGIAVLVLLWIAGLGLARLFAARRPTQEG